MNSDLGAILSAVLGADVESSPGIGRSGVGPFVHTIRPIDRYAGVVVLNRDDPTIRKGSEVTYTSADGLMTMPCVVTRRLRLRDGTLKLWVEGEPPTLSPSERVCLRSPCVVCHSGPDRLSATSPTGPVALSRRG